MTAGVAAGLMGVSELHASFESGIDSIDGIGFWFIDFDPQNSLKAPNKKAVPELCVQGPRLIYGENHLLLSANRRRGYRHMLHFNVPDAASEDQEEESTG